MASIKLLQVGLIRDKDNATKSPGSITRPEDVLPWLEDVACKDRECFVAVHLNARNVPIAVEVVSVGSLNASLVHPRELFKALILNNAAGVILAHNHPSGDPTPSAEDVSLTRRMMAAGDLLGIEVLDSMIVVPDGGHFSMGQKGMLCKP